jgi:hypothetical protein
MDATLQRVDRIVCQDPADVESRARLYRELVRHGRVDAAAISLAARLKDPAALLLESVDSYGAWSIRSRDLALLEGLPVAHLDLEHCELEDSGLGQLRSLPLRSLSLRNGLFTCEGLKWISHLRLNSLDLSWCIWIKGEALRHLSGLPLSSLNLTACVQVSNSGLAYLRDLPLEHLSLGCLYRITDDGLPALRGLPLRSLDLGYTSISDEGLLRTVEGMRLETLKINSCPRLTVAGVRALRKRFPETRVVWE